MIKKNYNKNQLAKEYDSHIDERTKNAIKKLRDYFGRKNTIQKIRNSYSFHYGPKDIGPTIDKMQDGDEFSLYVGEQHINSFYYASETVINKSMLYYINATDIKQAHDSFFGEIVEVHGAMLDFLNGFMQTAAGRHFIKTKDNPVQREIRSADLINLQEFKFPIFVDARKLSAYGTHK